MEQQITVPLSSDEPTGHLVQWVNLRVSHRQARTLKRMVIALRSNNIEVARPSGALRRVEDASDAIRWLLDRVGDEA